MPEQEDHRLIKPIEAAHFLGLSRKLAGQAAADPQRAAVHESAPQVRYSRAGLLRCVGKSLRPSTS